jgi:hypothetical protein
VTLALTLLNEDMAGLDPSNILPPGTRRVKKLVIRMEEEFGISWLRKNSASAFHAKYANAGQGWAWPVFDHR